MLRIQPPWADASLADAEAFKRWLWRTKPSLYARLDAAALLLVYDLVRKAWEQGQELQAHYIEAQFADLGPEQSKRLFAAAADDHRLTEIAQRRLQSILREIRMRQWDWRIPEIILDEEC